MPRYLQWLCVFAVGICAGLLLAAAVQPSTGSIVKGLRAENTRLRDKYNDANAKAFGWKRETDIAVARAEGAEEGLAEQAVAAERERSEAEARVRKVQDEAKRSTPSYSSATGDSIGALVAARQFVEDQLKCPSTAKHPWVLSSDVAKCIGGQWHVTTYVDAENSFGAKIRTHYAAVVSTTGDHNWSLHSLKVE